MYFIHMYFGHVNAQQIYTRMQILFQVKLAVKIKICLCFIEKYFNHSLFRTNTAFRIKFYALYIFFKNVEIQL